MTSPKYQFTKSEASVEENEAIKHLEEGFRILARLIVRTFLQEFYEQVKKQPKKNKLLGSIDPSDKMTFSVPEVAKLLGLSRASVYEAIRTKQIPSITFGNI